MDVLSSGNSRRACDACGRWRDGEGPVTRIANRPRLPPAADSVQRDDWLRQLITYGFSGHLRFSFKPIIPIVPFLSST